MQHPDPTFQAKLTAIQSRSSTTPETLLFLRTSNTKRPHLSIPTLQTFGATSESTTLEDLTSLPDFCQCLEKIQFPSQIVSILHDRRLQYLLLFRGGEVERRRLDFWLSSALVEGQEDGNLAGLLDICRTFVEVTKEVPACLEGFLRVFLREWDGSAHRESMFDLLLAIVPNDWEGLTTQFGNAVFDKDLDYRAEIVVPLEETFEKGADLGFAVALLRFYVSLFLRWAHAFNRSFLIGSAPSQLYCPPSKDGTDSFHGGFFLEQRWLTQNYTRRCPHSQQMSRSSLHQGPPGIITILTFFCLLGLMGQEIR
jgi:hypothetical protein